MEEINLKDDNSKKLLNTVYELSLKTYNTLNFIFNKTCSELLKNNIVKSKDFLVAIKSECETLAKTTDIQLLEFNWFKKTRINLVLNFNALIFDSTENLSKILVSEFNSAVIRIIYDIDNNPNAISEIIEIAQNLKKFLEKQYESYKKFLVKNPAEYGKSKDNKSIKNEQNLKKNSKQKSKFSGKKENRKHN